MSESILPLRQWPAGIQQASVPANDNALRVEALSRPCLGVANDATGTDADGDVWLVGSVPAGAFAAFAENDIALYEQGSWYAWEPVDGLRLVVNDVRKVFNGTAWIDDPSGGGGSGDVVGPASSVDSHVALFDGVTGKLLKDGGALGGMASINDAPSDGTGYVRKDGAWAVESGGGGGGMTNPMTTAGDIIYGGSGGTPARLAAGTDGYVLTLVSGSPAWAAAAGGGGLTNWAEGVNSAAPNAVAPYVYLVAANAATNVDVAISPKGSGAFSLAVADGTATGGNKRGQAAVDLQISRGSASSVASGGKSFCAGENNTASGAWSVAIGYNNTSSGTYSFSAGTNNAASGNTASSIGRLNTAAGDYSLALGYYSNDRGIYGAVVAASGRFSTSGDAQSMRLVLRATTSGTTPVVMASNGAAASAVNQLALPARTCSYAVKALVVAIHTTSGDTKSWEVTAHIKGAGSPGSAAMVSAATVTVVAESAGATTWTLAVGADTTYGALAFTGAGEASKTIKWVADVYGCAQVAL